MVKRRHWLSRLESAWTRRPVVWLRGVRRAGKTVLCRSLPEVEYFDCERPAVRRQIEDVDSFLAGLASKRVVLDEIHRLPDPAELLKVAADHFPGVKIVATGSSTLEATSRFKDKLTGRKAELWLTPMDAQDLEEFDGPSALERRLRQGGLPPFFLAAGPGASDFQEWIDSYWARDIQELFRLERRSSFGRFLELLFAQSGGLFEATRFSRPCEVSRQTISNYLAVLEATMAAQVVRPFSSRKATEIVQAPKVYGFDTGFVCHFKGWESLRPEDLGLLWEHYVLNELLSLRQRPLQYWRDKQGREVDFVVADHGRSPTAIECKWGGDSFDPTSLAAFRRLHPGEENWVVCRGAERPYERSFGGLRVRFIGVRDLPERLGSL